MLIGKLKVQTFFGGDIICQQGDINNEMYFIHKGIVDVLTSEQHKEIQVDELQEMDCFGMVIKDACMISIRICQFADARALFKNAS